MNEFNRKMEKETAKQTARRLSPNRFCGRTIGGMFIVLVFIILAFWR